MWRRPPLLPNFSRVSFPAATFQILSKPDNRRPSYARFCEIQDGGGGHLGCGADPRFYQILVENVILLLRFKFHQNRTINGRVIPDFVKFKMAAAAIFEMAQNAAFIIFQ